jgi:hypothetical protein
VRNEVDVVELVDLTDAGEEGALEMGEQGGCEAADPRVVRVGAECIECYLDDRETAEIMKRCTVREDIVKVGSRAQIWSMWCRKSSREVFCCLPQRTLETICNLSVQSSFCRMKEWVGGKGTNEEGHTSRLVKCAMQWRSSSMEMCAE